jgi:uncharacterized membrane protein YpjA
VERWDIAWVIIAFNFAGFVAGLIFWYGVQLLEAVDQWFLWPFIPDCPLFAGLFIIAFLGLRKWRDWRLFYTIAAFGLIKYGVWTVVFTLAHWRGGAPVEFVSLAMAFTHVGLIAEGLYVAYRVTSPPSGQLKQEAPTHRGVPSLAAGFRRRDVLLAGGWFLLSDIVDYGLGHYPQFDTGMVSLALIQWHTIFMTLALTGAGCLLSKRQDA